MKYRMSCSSVFSAIYNYKEGSQRSCSTIGMHAESAMNAKRSNEVQCYATLQYITIKAGILTRRKFLAIFSPCRYRLNIFIFCPAMYNVMYKKQQLLPHCSEHLCNAKVAGLGEILDQRKFSATCTWQAFVPPPTIVILIIYSLAHLYKPYPVLPELSTRTQNIIQQTI